MVLFFVIFYFHLIYSLIHQPFLSLLRGSWQFTDPESSVHSITWSARVHHDFQGHQPVDSMYVSDASEGIRANLALWDGDKYFLSVHACNGAGICLLQDEVEFLVDVIAPFLSCLLSLVDVLFPFSLSLVVIMNIHAIPLHFLTLLDQLCDH